MSISRILRKGANAHLRYILNALSVLAPILATIFTTWLIDRRRVRKNDQESRERSSRQKHDFLIQDYEQVVSENKELRKENERLRKELNKNDN